jgi:hypothetical protein
MNVKQILQDPNFQGLPEQERLKVLRTVDPMFAGLPEAEQFKVIGGGKPTASPEKTAGIPELIGRGLIEQLPVAGMMAGGAIGTAAGGLGAVPGAALGAGVGAAGRGLGRRLLGEPVTAGENIADIAGAIPVGAMAEMGGQVLGKAVKGAFAPGRKWIETQLAQGGQARAAQELAAQGVPISPKHIAPSRTAKAVTWLAERFQPGKSIVDNYRRQTMDMLMEMRRNAVQQMGLPPVGSMPLGAAKDQVSQVFSQFRHAAGPDAVIPLPQTQQFVRTLSPEKVGKTSVDFMQTMQERLKPGSLSVADIERLNASLWPKGKAYARISAMDKAWREEFLQHLYRDLAAHEMKIGVNLADLLQQAKGTTRNIYQAQYIERLLDRATDNQNLMFNPQRFYDLVRSNQAGIQRSLSKDVAQNLFAFADKMKAAAPERAAFMRSREPNSLFEQAWSSGPALGLGGASIYGTPAMAVPVGFQGWAAWSLMKPSGVIRKWLTTGYKPPVLPAKIGLMEYGLRAAQRPSEK